MHLYMYAYLYLCICMCLYIIIKIILHDVATVMEKPHPKHPMHVKFNLIMYCTASKTVLGKLYTSKCIENMGIPQLLIVT